MIIFDQVLKAKKAPFRVPVLAAAIGIYLPLETMVPIFIGGLLNYLVTKTFGKGLSEEEAEKRNRKGMLFSAGLITGEALMGILMAIAIVVMSRGDALALPAGMQLGGSRRRNGRSRDSRRHRLVAVPRRREGRQEVPSQETGTFLISL